jgi:hypothetical protein
MRRSLDVTKNLIKKKEIHQRMSTQSSFLLARQMQQQQELQATRTAQILQQIQANVPAITSTIQSELRMLQEERYTPYRPRAVEVMPQSVIDLQMRTANVGVPVPTMTIANCKGIQFVTK